MKGAEHRNSGNASIKIVCHGDRGHNNGNNDNITTTVGARDKNTLAVLGAMTQKRNKESHHVLVQMKDIQIARCALTFLQTQIESLIKKRNPQ